MVMPYHLHMPSYFLETFTEYPLVNIKRRCVVIHDAPSFFFIDYKNRFIFFKLRYFEDFFGLCVRNI